MAERPLAPASPPPAAAGAGPPSGGDAAPARGGPGTPARPDAPPASQAIPPRPGPERTLLLAIPLAVAVLIAGLSYTGALNENTLLLSPGEFVVVGLPIVRLMHNIGASLTIGFLVLAVFALPGQKKIPGNVSRVQATAVRWAGWSACGWLLSSVLLLFFVGASTLGAPIGSEAFTRQFATFLTGVEMGQYSLLSAGCVALALGVMVFARRQAWTAFALALCVIALLPLALSGHAAGADEHTNAVNSLALHIVAATAWVGGLAALVMLRRRIGRAMPVVVERYSTLAAWAFIVVTFSGVVNASLRIADLDDLLTPYGQLVIAKTVLLIALGVFGAYYRLRLIRRLRSAPESRGLFAQLAAVEVLLMGLAMGLAVALSRSATPVPQDPLAQTGDEALAIVRRSLLGFPYPEPLSIQTMLTSWQPDWLWIFAAVAGIYLYVRSVLRLRRRGDAWPLSRTVFWVAGCLMLIYVTSGGPGVYGKVFFGTHMIQHMGLMMYVPPLLVLGGPVLLAMRVLPVRGDGSRGLREWMLAIVHSRYLRVLSNPAVAGVLFSGSLVAFYYTGWYEWAMYTHQGHLLMMVHFLASGYLFFWVMIGVDPGPSRPLYPLRLILLLATMAFHAFFGLTLMSGTEILAESWWTALGYLDPVALLEQQRIGGGVAWGAGEFPTVLVALAVMVQWKRSEERAATRYDRAAARDGDAELNAYNRRLERIEELHPTEARRPGPDEGEKNDR